MKTGEWERIYLYKNIKRAAYQVNTPYSFYPRTLPLTICSIKFLYTSVYFTHNSLFTEDDDSLEFFQEEHFQGSVLLVSCFTLFSSRAVGWRLFSAGNLWHENTALKSLFKLYQHSCQIPSHQIPHSKVPVESLYLWNCSSPCKSHAPSERQGFKVFCTQVSLSIEPQHGFQLCVSTVFPWK